MFEILQKLFAAIVAFFTAIFGGGGGNLPILPGTTASQTVVMRISPMGSLRQFQGACSDGEYVYQIFTDPSTKTGKEKSAIVKIDPTTWKSVSVSKAMVELNHANDITYDPRIDLLMITNNAPNYTLVSAVYRDSLEYKAGMTIEHPLCCICYQGISNKGEYYAGISGGYDIGSYDGKFDAKEILTGIDNGCVRQSLETDNAYLYYLFSDPNCIYKYDFEGKYVGKVNLPDPEKDTGLNYEAEGIFFYNGNMYVTYNIRGTENGGVICRIDKADFAK